MFQKISAYLSALALALTLGACAAPGSGPGEMEIRTGVIEQITNVQIASNQHRGVGAVVGGTGASLPPHPTITTAAATTVTNEAKAALRRREPGWCVTG